MSPLRGVGNDDVGGQVGDRGQPVFELGVEARLRAAGLQVEEAEHQRAGKAEQRRREGRAHAGQRRRQPGLQRVEHRAAVARTGIERLDGVADRADRREQAPEGAEQAEEDQQADQVAQDVAALVEAGGDRIRAWCASSWSKAPCVDDATSSAFIGASSTGSVTSEPARKELTQRTSRNSRTICRKAQQDADHENAEDQAVEAGIGGEGGGDLPGQDGGDEGDDGQEDQHRQQEDLRAGQLVRVVLHHVRRADQSEGFSSMPILAPIPFPAIKLIADFKRNCDEIGRR